MLAVVCVCVGGGGQVGPRARTVNRMVGWPILAVAMMSEVTNWSICRWGVGVGGGGWEGGREGREGGTAAGS